jgi:hypothetical protein
LKSGLKVSRARYCRLKLWRTERGKESDGAAEIPVEWTVRLRPRGSIWLYPWFNRLGTIVTSLWQTRSCGYISLS